MAAHDRGRARPARPAGARAGSSGSSRRRLGVDAPLLGAAELAFEPLLADPASWLRPRDVRHRAGERLIDDRTIGRPRRACDSHRGPLRSTSIRAASPSRRPLRRSDCGEGRVARLAPEMDSVREPCIVQGSPGGGETHVPSPNRGVASRSPRSQPPRVRAAAPRRRPRPRHRGRQRRPRHGRRRPAAAGCTVGVSWNNYQEERWAKWDEPAIKAALAAGGAQYISNDAKSSAETQTTDVENLISQGAKVLIILAQDGTADQVVRHDAPLRPASRSSPTTA